MLFELFYPPGSAGHAAIEQQRAANEAMSELVRLHQARKNATANAWNRLCLGCGASTTASDQHCSYCKRETL